MRLKLDWTPGYDSACAFQRIYLSTISGEKGKMLAEVNPSVSAYTIPDIDEATYWIYILQVSKDGREENWKSTPCSLKKNVTIPEDTITAITSQAASVAIVTPTVGVKVVIDPPKKYDAPQKVEVIQGDASTGKLVGVFDVVSGGNDGDAGERQISVEIPYLPGKADGTAQQLTIRAVDQEKRIPQDLTGITVSVRQIATPNHGIHDIASIVDGTVSGFTADVAEGAFEYGAYGVRLKELPTRVDADADWGTRSDGILAGEYSGAYFITNATITSKEIDLIEVKSFQLQCSDNWHKETPTGSFGNQTRIDADWPRGPSMDQDIATEPDSPIWLAREMTRIGHTIHPSKPIRWQYRVSDTSPVTGDWVEWVPGVNLRGRYVMARMIINEPLGQHQMEASEVYVKAMVAWSDDITDPMRLRGEYTEEPTGFPNRTDSTLVFDDANRKFTLEPAVDTFDVWVHGQRFHQTTAMSVTWPDTEGLHWFYVTPSGVLTAATVADVGTIIEDNAFVSYIYWNADNNISMIRGEERHGMKMDGSTHRYLHETVGTVWESGAAITGYTLDTGTDTAVKIGYSAGEIDDEDINFDVPVASHPATIPMWYRKDQAVWRYQVEDFPFLYPGGTSDYASGTYPAYNKLTGATWGLTEVGNLYYFNTWVFATTGLSFSVAGIPSQSVSLDKNDALTEQFNDLDLTGLPFQEAVLLYRVTYQSKSNFGGTYKTTMVGVEDFRGSTPIGGNYVPTNHASLAGLDGDAVHPAASVNTTAASFDLRLGSTETDVHKALVRLDAGPVKIQVKEVGATGYTITNEDTLILMNAGQSKVTLPDPTANPNLVIIVKKIDAVGGVTIGTPTGGIDGSSTFVLGGQYLALEVASDGADWWIISKIV